LLYLTVTSQQLEKKKQPTTDGHRKVRSGSPSEKEIFCEFVLQDLATAQNDQNLLMTSLIRGTCLRYTAAFTAGTDPV